MALRRFAVGILTQAEYAMASGRFLAAGVGPISDTGFCFDAAAKPAALHTTSRELHEGQAPHSYQQRRGLKLFEVRLACRGGKDTKYSSHLQYLPLFQHHFCCVPGMEGSEGVN